MIKCARYVFPEKVVKSGILNWLETVVFYEPIGFIVDKVACVDDFGFNIEDDRYFEMSLDQSTTNTGIVLRSIDNCFVYLIEFSRNKRWSAEEYIIELERFLHILCEGKFIARVVYERPIKAKGFRSTQVLFHLEGMILQLGRRYKEFEGIDIVSVPVTSWRSAVVMDKYKPYGVKTSVRCSLCEIFSWVADYGVSIGKDGDIFDAVGVMFGNLSREMKADFDRLGFNVDNVQYSVAVVESRKRIDDSSYVTMYDGNIESIKRLAEIYSVVCVRFPSKCEWRKFCLKNNIQVDFEKLGVENICVKFYARGEEVEASCDDEGIRQVLLV